MSSRGRGYGGHGGFKPRGYSTYRGSQYRGGRGTYNDRGRGGYNNMSNDRYNASGGDRYSTRNERPEEMSYKKSYRSDGPSYGSREYSSRGGSPDRKRMRMEGSGGGRRSHDTLNHYGVGTTADESHPNAATQNRAVRLPVTTLTARASTTCRPARFTRRPSEVSWCYALFSTLVPRTCATGLSRFLPRHLIQAFLPQEDSTFATDLRPPPQAGKAQKGKRGSASSSEAEDWDIDDKKPEDDLQADTPAEIAIKREPKEEGGDEEVTDKEAVDAASGDEAEANTSANVSVPHSKLAPRAFIRLICTHCREKYLTFKMYAKHLLSSRHCYVMDDVALKLKFMQQRMRITQRKAQRMMEQAAGAELSPDTAFCSLCKLIYRTTTHDHNRSEAHRNMKEFLMPYCKACHVTFRSPMIYEHHICSLEHIKKKARLEHKQAKPAKAGDQGSEDEGMDVDLENFMTLDSVGDVDEVEDGDSTGEKKVEEGTDSKPKLGINVGNEHIKKFEVHYCELCKTYLPRGESEEMVVKRHCRKRTHLSRYVRFCDDHTLRRQAERIHRIHQQAKETIKGKEATTAESGTGEASATPSASKTGDASKVNGAGQKPKATGQVGEAEAEEGAEGEEKLWAEVDKELGGLLRDSHAHTHDTNNKSSDDEDDTNTTGRYDRFRKSDKKAEIIENAVEESATSVEDISILSVKEPELEVVESVDAAAEK